jgi:hypothetical protein
VATRRNPDAVLQPRIGIDDDGHALPILGGGRVTGRVGKYSVGLVNIQTRHDRALAAPATNFSVMRLRRDILRRSNIGLMVNRAESGGNRKQSDLRRTVRSRSSRTQPEHLLRTHADTGAAARTVAGAQLHNADRYGLVLEHMLIGENFNPETGYVRRNNARRNMAEARFSPRPRSSSVVRKYEYSVGIDQYERATDGMLETRLVEAVVGIEFQSSDRLALTLSDNVEALSEPYEVADEIDVSVGRYQFKNLNARYDFARSTGCQEISPTITAGSLPARSTRSGSPVRASN